MTCSQSRQDSMAAALLAQDEGYSQEEALQWLHSTTSIKRIKYWLLAEAALTHIPHLPPEPDQAGRSVATSLHGWQPPLVHDVLLQAWRVATQADVDRMERTIRELGCCWADVQLAIKRCKDEMARVHSTEAA